MTLRYPVIYADPPWSYKDHLQMADTARSSADNYATMPVDDICQLYRPSVLDARNGLFPATLAGHAIADDALLFLWVTNPMLLDGTGAAVCNAWGFTPAQLVTWTKGRYQMYGPSTPGVALHMGMGHMLRGVTEHVIVGHRGRPKHLIKDKGVVNWLLAPRGKHSAKPEAMYDLIERLVDGPYLELFARTRRDGWTAWGNEIAPPVVTADIYSDDTWNHVIEYY